jgi:hypothetical protein
MKSVLRRASRARDEPSNIVGRALGLALLGAATASGGNAQPAPLRIPLGEALLARGVLRDFSEDLRTVFRLGGVRGPRADADEESLDDTEW